MNISLLLMLGASIAFGQGASLRIGNDSELAMHLIALQNEFFGAVQKRDSAALGKMLHPEFLLTSSESNGQYADKPRYIDACMRPEVLTVRKFVLRDYLIHVTGNVAIVRSRIDWESMYRQKPWNTSFLNTDIFIRTDGGEWLILSRHSSYPAADLPRIVKERHSGG